MRLMLCWQLFCKNTFLIITFDLDLDLLRLWPFAKSYFGYYWTKHGQSLTEGSLVYGKSENSKAMFLWSRNLMVPFSLTSAQTQYVLSSFRTKKCIPHVLMINKPCAILWFKALVCSGFCLFSCLRIGVHILVYVNVIVKLNDKSVSWGEQK